jgi:hypothetical protein
MTGDWPPGKLTQVHLRLRVGEVIVDAVFEGHAHKGQTVKGSRSDIVNAWSDVESDLHRYGVVTLHFFGREPGRLRGDFQNDGGGIGISLDI